MDTWDKSKRLGKHPLCRTKLTYLGLNTIRLQLPLRPKKHPLVGSTCLSKCKHQTLYATLLSDSMVCVCSMQSPCLWWACDLWEGVNPIYEKRQIRPLLFRTILCVLCLFHMILHLHVCLWDFAAILLEEHSSVMDRGALQDYCISCIDASPWCPQLISILGTQLALSVL